MRRRPRRRPPYLPPGNSERLYLSLPGANVGLLRFLLEGYGHMACMTVVDRYAAVVRLFFAPTAREEVLEFVAAAACEIPGLAVRLAPRDQSGPGGTVQDACLSPP
ncbi:DUF4911 domain-containing protein [Desulfovibrio sulfodismutans]|uniref:DUF4911 domain-containing protein n=1 Tax=Desulfolutivibrio sulfodismutans TaxID=63561 RepID=A0A7K3NG64_9BACT|nr:DUF4911 domain-containing protein [Desulfolutivibrio sulfodismutans]NDY55176.1 DUF4911 domain-containing protein [Desulfolutivibrio sulfodismutans]QLA12144.1 DUF4911 domain-containing protein [Desulfolutivibrio sulfodismutans DSM 3696]